MKINEVSVFISWHRNLSVKLFAIHLARSDNQATRLPLKMISVKTAANKKTRQTRLESRRPAVSDLTLILEELSSSGEIQIITIPG